MSEMDINNLFSELADLGVCQSGKRLWTQSSKDLNMIIKVWKRWPEYLVEHSIQALPILRSFFSSDDLIERLVVDNIYLDHSKDVELSSDNSVFFIGDCNCHVKVKDWGTVKIYCFNKSSLSIDCGFHSYVNVECYNNTKIDVACNNGACTVYSYDDSDVKSNGKVSVVRKKIERGNVFNGEEIQF